VTAVSDLLVIAIPFIELGVAAALAWVIPPIVGIEPIDP
jgi:hypothetical protein